ncbi:Crp/Fnr family transcriptional regulator [Aurantiacibacter gangjinensis]|uniref:Crp/Fnr family transcriptional regulator n=1 Tax=Aurantiacibacter gangjinensis TaxID=502682 RepID=UPI00069CADF0|nr:Crp/Fnr family transcriptional regulator [Aurantiacibacter gangjinensis]APE28059.1 transcriptional regulator, Crp/Fnr family [Aurantiacibacter gangjinensis]
MPDREFVAIVQAALGCTENSALEATQFAARRLLERAKVAYHQGSFVQTCNIIISGSADLRLLSQDGKYFQMATVEVGELFGVYPDSAEIPVDVIAREGAEFLSFDAASLAKMALNDSSLGAALAEKFAMQNSALLGRFAARLTLSASGRVCEQLLLAMDEDRRVTPVPVISALAILAQTTRETASRTISNLERRGILTRHADHWLIVAPRTLEDALV